MPPIDPLILFGRATSSNVQIVTWALAELSLPVTRLDFGHIHGGTDTPDYRAMNPNGLVPTLRDGDLVLWESAAILRYLGARYGSAAFWPPDPLRRAPLDMWAEWVKTSFGPTFLQQLFYPLIRTPLSKIAPEAAANGAARIAPLAQMLSDRIGEGPWLAGETFSFADILAGHMLYRFYTVPFHREDLPPLADYYARLCDRPAYRQHVMIDYSGLRPKEP
jgi:glutathione S-transferase